VPVILLSFQTFTTSLDLKKMNMNKSPAIIALTALSLLYSCSPTQPKITFKMSPQPNGTLKISGPDASILGEIQRDSIPGLWQSLIPVYRMPADTDLKDYQPPQPGIYSLQDSIVVFKPDTPFVKGRAYFIRYYHYDETKSIWDMVKNKQKLGSQPHNDLVFKY
jgi:hypothetical protein